MKTRVVSGLSDTLPNGIKNWTCNTITWKPIKTQTAGFHSQSFIFSRFGIKNLHVWQVHRWCWCSLSGDCTLRTTALPRQAWHSYAEDVIFSWKKLSLVFNPLALDSLLQMRIPMKETAEKTCVGFDLCLCGLVYSWYSRDSSLVPT